VESEPGDSAVRAGIPDASHDLFQGGDAGLWGSSSKWIPPSLFAGSIPGVRIGSIDPVTMMWALGSRPLIDQCAEGPALQCAVSRAR
jgi:hypothetical protein